MKTLRYACGLTIGATLGLAPNALSDSRVIAVADFGTNSSNSTPDGCSDLLWHDIDTGELVIHYMSKDGLSVGNVVGSIEQIEVLFGGSGYFSSDTLSIDSGGTGGLGLDAKLQIIGPIAELIVDDPGRDYINGTIEELVPGSAGGSGCIAVTTIADGGADSGQVAAIKLVQRGAGFEVSDDGVSPRPHVLIALSTADGDPAIAQVWSNASGQIMDASSGFGPSIIDNGSGFIDTPTFQFLSPTAGAGASFQAYLYGGIMEVTVALGGSDYTSDPEWVFPGDGIGAKVTTSRGPGSIDSIEVTTTGRNYVLAPTITVDGEGNGAALEPVVNQNGPTPLTRKSSSSTIYVGGGKDVEAHAGDFDGDGDNDIIFRRADREEVFLWIMEDGAKQEGARLDAFVGDSWKVAGIGDLDFDGIDDIYWWNEGTGRLCIWHIDYIPGQPSTWLSRRSSFAGWVGNTDWRPFSVRDITGAHDGDEILWGNTETGAVAIRMRNPDQPKYLQLGIYVREPGGALLNAGTDWEPRHFGDFDSNDFDGDIFWYNPEDGRTAVWRMHLGTAFDRDYLTSDVGDAATSYHPVGVAQYLVEDEESGLATKHSHVLWSEADLARVVNWRMDRSLQNIAAGSTEFGDEIDPGTILRPYKVDRAVLLGVDGITSDIDFQPPVIDDFGDFDFGGIGGDANDLGDKEDESGSGGGGFDIDAFDALDQSTWPSGVDTADEMITWIGNNVLANDPTSWPSGIDSEAALATWLIQNVTLLDSL